LHYEKLKENEYIKKNYKKKKESAFSLYDGISNHEEDLNPINKIPQSISTPLNISKSNSSSSQGSSCSSSSCSSGYYSGSSS
jgi:hypothetical protein